MASGCVPGSGGRRAGSGRGGQDRDEAVKVYLIRFIADLQIKAGIQVACTFNLSWVWIVLKMLTYTDPWHRSPSSAT